mgnify:CR=1 FL=1
MPNKTRRIVKKRKQKKEELIEEHKECPICYEEMNEETIKTLPCDHEFHTECINKWLHNHATCPLCREPAEQVVATPLFIKRRRAVEEAEQQRGIIPFLGVTVCYKNRIIGKHLNTEFNLRTENTLGDLQNAVIERYGDWANSGICQTVASAITNTLYGSVKNRFSCVPTVRRVYQGTPSNCNLLQFGSVYNMAIEDDVPLHVEYELYQHNAMETHNDSNSVVERRNTRNVLMAHREFDFFYNEDNPVVPEEHRDPEAVALAIENPHMVDIAMKSTTHSLSWITMDLGYKNVNSGGKKKTRKHKRL